MDPTDVFELCETPGCERPRTPQPAQGFRSAWCAECRQARKRKQWAESQARRRAAAAEVSP